MTARRSQPAGRPVDATIEALLPHLDEGDILIDGGNSNFKDTMRRAETCRASGHHFVDVGTSGGVWGLAEGYSMMVGGDVDVVESLRPIFETLAPAPDKGWGRTGDSGAGHYVKMVHNGIEYGDMQVIAEAYDVMRRGLGLTPAEMRPIFTRWNEGRLDSFLIDITRDIMGTVDTDGAPLLDRVLDAAGQKGTGKWTVVASMDQAMPTTLVSEAVYARIVSALVGERAAAARVLSGPTGSIHDEREDVIADLEDALYASKIVSYAQGFMLFEAASEEYGWNLDPGTIASLWRAGSRCSSGPSPSFPTAGCVLPRRTM